MEKGDCWGADDKCTEEEDSEEYDLFGVYQL
jgi:hypothetical protein